MTIQTIIDKFDEIKPLGLTPDDKLVHLEESDKRVLKAYQQQIRLFLKDSLTSMLDGIIKDCPQRMEHQDNETKEQEYIISEHNGCVYDFHKIINSHR